MLLTFLFWFGIFLFAYKIHYDCGANPIAICYSLIIDI